VSAPTIMMICYYKGAFGLGLFVAFLIWSVVTLFEDVIAKWFKRIIKVLK